MSVADVAATVPPDKQPSYFEAVLPLIVLTILVGGSVALFGLDAMEGPLQVAMLLSGMTAAIIVLRKGHSWEAVSDASRRGVGSVVSAIFILLAVGGLIGTWNMAGTIPTLVYYGLAIIDPNWFYAASLIVCALISLGIGSSWTTVGTIGVGLMGLAWLAGVSPVITAGAIVSGAYTGDKLSPLSETTILAAQLTNNDLYVHLRHQAWVSVPAFLVAAIGLSVLGFAAPTPAAGEALINSELGALDQLFWITPINLLPLLLLIIMSLRKVPASLALTWSSLFAGVLACFTQPQAVQMMMDPDLVGTLEGNIKAVWQVIATGYQANSGIGPVDDLLSRGGMASMLLTIWLIVAALAFGSILDEFGFLSKLVTPLLTRAKQTGSLIATSVGTAIGLNVITADQYVAVVLPTRLFRVEFQKRGLASTNLSRAVSNGGIVTAPLVPWNSCGAYMAAVLGVPTFAYLPYAIFNYMSPLIDMLYGFTGFKIARITEEEAAQTADISPGDV
ncbi:Na+/H+ antiporter NhaC [Altererythrobacter sp. Root672]|uniref:Na+/H+ antiporter NhaC n=1 Tax=Altererythrobacter sp. Root672 TaxID=1736584 RepID=UPI0006F305E9|nr:Na+/H+ antiporter NhaC [Altererythrobacter sp. Root672]KRA83313.1 sodium:proton antiporter [Altererythrobacter sp. Root672]